MKNLQMMCMAMMVLAMTVVSQAQNKHWWEQESMTDGFWGLNETLEPTGIETAFSVTSIYQRNVKGITKPYKTSCFCGTVNIKNSCQYLRLICDNANGPAANTGKSYNHIFSIIFVDFHKFTVINK